MNKRKKQKTGYFALIRAMSGVAGKKLLIPFLLMILCSISAGVVQGSGVWFKQQLFDQARAAAEGAAFSKVLMAAIALCIFLIVQLLMNAVNQISMNSFQLKMEQAAGEELNRKAARVDPICYEDNRFLDHIEKAGRGTQSAVSVFMLTFSIILSIVSYFGFMGGYLFSIEPMLLVMLFCSFIPYILGSVVRYRVHRTMENQAAPYRRRGEYYGQCITDREYAKETRMLGGYGYFYRKMKENLQMVRTLAWRTARKSELVDLVLRFLSMAGYVGTVIMLFYYLMTGRVGVGIFAAVASSLDGMSDTLEILFNFNINSITGNLGLAENYLAFLTLPERKALRQFPEAKTVEFKDVSFAYPNAARDSVSRLSLFIKENETIAIVGSNGAGKSTFARLLLGIYQPTEGVVLIDGVDTKEILPGESAGKCSAVFQRFQKYKMKVSDNIFMSNTLDAFDTGRVEESLEKADLELNERSFPEGLNTVLAREFGGTDLSGGQWQRLAIARGLYRRHNLIVLDEPTSAIDPLEETRVYEKFVEMSKDKTAVIITHRLGSAKIADRIVVLDEGSIAEMGTHNELMDKKGLYYRMFQAQAKWYA